jgi:hypothetical protein
VLADAMREVGEAFAKCDPRQPDAAAQKELAEAIESLQAVARAFAPVAPVAARSSLTVA